MEVIWDKENLDYFVLRTDFMPTNFDTKNQLSLMQIKCSDGQQMKEQSANF